MANIKITRIGVNPYIEDEKKPHKLIREVKPGSRKDLFQIIIKHPNKNWFLPEIRDVLKEHGLWTKEVRKLIVREKSIENVDLPAKLKKKFNKPEKILKDEKTHDILFDKQVRCKDMFEALDKAREIEEEQFSDVETEYEEIKFIPHGKKGRMKLKRKGDEK